jgi:5-methylcytosine-specific restriction endonuclease McrA
MDKKTVEHIIKYLRKSTITWTGRRDCLRRARKKVFDGQYTKNGKPIYKFHWQCAACREWFKDIKMLEVDHIDQIGPFEGNWDNYINKMFCEQSNLQALCVVCHKKKTYIGNATIAFKRRPR